MISVAILYHDGARQPLSIARTRDEDLVARVAAACVREAEEAATELSQRDPVLGLVQAEETAKLRRLFGLLLPKPGAVTTQ